MKNRFLEREVIPLGFVCEFGGEGRGGLWRERNREKIRKIFYIF
jgi:hypothetical protein